MTVYAHSYPPLPLRIDLVGTPWWQTLVTDVAPQYLDLIRTFEQNTEVVTTDNSAEMVRYQLGNANYTYQRRRAKPGVVLALIDGVVALQALLDKADASVRSSIHPSCLLIDLSAVTIEGDLHLPELRLPQLLCYQTIFEGIADFSKVGSVDSACFDEATFKGDAKFDNVSFEHGLSSFRKTIFCRDAGFFCLMGSVLFDATVIVGNTDFEGAIMRCDKVQFQACRFLGDTDFSG